MSVKTPSLQPTTNRCRKPFSRHFDRRLYRLGDVLTMWCALRGIELTPGSLLNNRFRVHGRFPQNARSSLTYRSGNALYQESYQASLQFRVEIHAQIVESTLKKGDAHHIVWSGFHFKFGQNTTPKRCYAYYDSKKSGFHSSGLKEYIVS